MAAQPQKAPLAKPAPVRPVPPPINSPQYQPPPPPPGPKKPAPWRYKVRKAVPWLLAVLLTAVVLQIAMGAAMALGGDFGYLEAHGIMAGILHLLPLIVLILAALGADWPAFWGGLVVLVIVVVQFPWLEMDGALRGLHVLGALLAFTITLLLLRDRMPWVSSAPARSPSK